MSYLDILRNGVKTIDSQTKSLQATVTFRRYISEDAFGTRTYGPSVKLKAVVEKKQKSVKTMTGELSVCQASIIFLDITSLVIATVGDGIDDNDIIVLPDGSTGPILNFDGFVDAGTGKPIATEVYLG